MKEIHLLTFLRELQTCLKKKKEKTENAHLTSTQAAKKNIKKTFQVDRLSVHEIAVLWAIDSDVWTWKPIADISLPKITSLGGHLIFLLLRAEEPSASIYGGKKYLDLNLRIGREKWHTKNVRW